MKSRLCIAVPILLLAAACGRKEPETAVRQPAVKVDIVAVGAYDARITVRSAFCSEIVWSCAPDGPSGTETGLDETVAGKETELFIQGLAPLSTYTFSATGRNREGKESSPQQVSFSTTVGPDGLYPWESRRSAPLPVADMTLVSRGQHRANPPAWTPERFASHVVYTDEQGEGHWFFDSFLCIEGYDGVRGRTFSIQPTGHSATRESWEELLDYWFAPEGALKALDDAVGKAASTLGPPPFPRQVIMAVPDPIMFETFGDKQSSTSYWGSIDGVRMDFSRTDHQLKAFLWYVDECRARFGALAPKNLELLGFYVLSEELPLDPAFYGSLGLNAGSGETWNWQYKRWETLLPAAAAYLHGCREGFYWIPYYYAPGYRVWKDLGFDAVFMQPNHYWDTENQHPLSRTATALRQYGMGMELEFEYSMVSEVMRVEKTGPDGAGNMIFTEADVPALKDRFRAYMDMFRENGFYGKHPVALYSGTDALFQLAHSRDPEDRKIYHELGRFITESPLKTASAQ